MKKSNKTLFFLGTIIFVLILLEEKDKCIEDSYIQPVYLFYEVSENNLMQLQNINKDIDKDGKEDFTPLQPETAYNECEWKPVISEEQKESSGYQIKSEIYQENDKLAFQYPQISGLDDKEKERAINELILADLIETRIRSVLEDDGSGYIQPWDRVIGNLEYEITLQTSDILSVFYEGYTALEASSRFYETSYSITIDLQNAVKLELSDFVEIDDAFVEKIKESNVVKNMELENKEASEELYEHLLKALQELENERIINGLKNKEMDYGFYLMSDALVISIGETSRQFVLVKLQDMYNYQQNKTLIELNEERGMKQANEMNSPLDSWIGEYEFHENIGSAEEPPFMFLDYKIKIYKDASQSYYANILIDGQTTAASGKAKVIGNEKWIDLIFLEYLPDHISGGFPNKEDSILISFERVDGMLLTYWGEILPMLYDNEEPGRIYFEKVKE